MESPKAPNNKCDFAALMKPNLFWIFSSVLKMSDSTSQRYGYCDNINTAFLVSHSCNQQTANIKQDKNFVSVCYSSSKEISETEDKPSDSFFSINQDKRFNILEVKNIPFSSKIHHLYNFTVMNLSMKYMYKFCKIFTTHKKHIVSNFDMNAISPTSW